jgi:prevent-host-death family protein
MRRIGASKFKEQCLSLLDDLSAEGIVITKRGKPVARVIPIGSAARLDWKHEGETEDQGRYHVHRCLVRVPTGCSVFG